jgi:hypothetical protein
MALVTVAFACSIGMAEAAPTSTPPYTVSVSPTSVVAGSSGNALRFRFSATRPADGLVSVAVPAVASGSAWTTPQFTDSAAAGFVTAAKQTCNSAWVSSVSGDGGGPGTIFVNAKCNKDQHFTLTYGAGTGSRVTAPTKAGPYTFTAKAVVRGVFVALAAQPVVTVNARRAVTLGVTGLANAVAGTPQTPTVTAKDRYGNTAVGYRGTVHFTGSGDPPTFYVGDSDWSVPSDYTFTAGDGGTHTFAATARTAGAQTLTAADSQTNWITTGSQTITVSPGPTAWLAAMFSSVPGAAIPGQTVQLAIVVTAGDGYGNVATGDNTFVTVRVTKQGSDSCDGCSDLISAALENGRQTFNIRVAVVSTQLHVSAFPVPRSGENATGAIYGFIGAPPNLDEVKLDWDPTTQNPDGTYNGHLDIKDPNSATVQQLTRTASLSAAIPSSTPMGRPFFRSPSTSWPAARSAPPSR